MATLPMYVVYENPSDYPGKFVVRRWLCMAAGARADTAPLIVCDSLEVARAVVPPYAVCLQRSPEDDPSIREVWL